LRAWANSSAVASVPHSLLALASMLPPSLMSVPRPAMLVAMVTAPFAPASSMIMASRAWFLALSTSCLMPMRRSSNESISLFSMLMVPTKMGWPVL